MDKIKKFESWYLPYYEEHFLRYIQNGNSYQSIQRTESLKHIKKRRKAIDIGANVGLWARDLCGLFNKVILFEPNSLNTECLKKNLENFNNFKIYQVALSNMTGYKDLFLDEKGCGNHSLKPVTSVQTKKEKVELKTLDEYDFKEIDYIKIDAQFHELEIIEGSINTFKNNDPILCIEACRRNHAELEYVNSWVKILIKLSYKKIGQCGKEIFYKKVN